MSEPLLVVVNGPVGGGKSTVSLALADRYRESGRTAAVIDLDLLYHMARQTDRLTFDNTALTTARRGVAALADSFFADGMGVVIVDGEFFAQEELDTLRNNIATDIEHQFVTLVVSYQKALERVAGDTGRTLSADPTILKRLHERFVEALPFLEIASLLVDADHRTPGELAELIRDAKQSGSDW